MSSTKAALIYTTLPDPESARAIAGSLLDERLIACANILGPIEAVFVYEGRKQSANETGALFKTTENRLDLVVERICQLHPYDTPAILADVCSKTHGKTLAWLEAQTSPSDEAEEVK